MTFNVIKPHNRRVVDDRVNLTIDKKRIRIGFPARTHMTLKMAERAEIAHEPETDRIFVFPARSKGGGYKVVKVSERSRQIQAARPNGMPQMRCKPCRFIKWAEEIDGEKIPGILIESRSGELI